MPTPCGELSGLGVSGDGERADIRASRIRFKARDDPTLRSRASDERGDRHPKRRRRYDDEDHEASTEPRHRHRHSSRRHHSRLKTSKRESAGADHAEPTMADPDSAFRESLFDAMADDEGADFWQGVYGQPVHVYGNTKPGPDGELERMTEEEYITHVRARMWEKTHQSILEERARREEAARKRAEQKKEAHANATRFQSQMEESLRRGTQRRLRKEWQAAFNAYDAAWKQLQESQDGTRTTPVELPWPVQTGRRNDVTSAAVEEFMCQTAEDSGYAGKKSGRLKMERVRWHPDKMVQRMGGAGLQGEDLKAVTAVFQILDELWSRSK